MCQCDSWWSEWPPALVSLDEPAPAELPPDHLAQVRPRRRLYERLDLRPLLQLLAGVTHPLVDEAQRVRREVERHPVARRHEARAGKSELGHARRRFCRRV